MEIPSISSMCSEALLTQFRLELEADEIDNLSVDPSVLNDEFAEGAVRIKARERILLLGVRFLETTLEICESCDYNGTKNEVECPNIDTFGFIRDTLAK